MNLKHVYFLLTFLSLQVVWSQPMSVGVLIPQSGDYAVIGKDCEIGIQAAQPKNLRLIYGDNQSKNNLAVSEFNKMADVDKVHAVILIRSPIGLAVNPLSHKAKIPLLGGVAHPGFVADNEYAFQIYAKAHDEGAAVARDMLAAGIKSAAVLTTEDDYLIGMTDGFLTAFKNGGGAIVSNDNVTPSETDFSGLATRLKQRKPEGVFINLGITQLGVAFKRFKELGIREPIYSNYWASKKEVRSVAGDGVVAGIKYVEPTLDFQSFNAALAATAKDYTPSAITFSCYVSARLLDTVGNRLALSGIPFSSAAAYKALLETQSIQLGDSEIRLVNRILEWPVVIKEIKGSRRNKFNK